MIIEMVLKQGYASKKGVYLRATPDVEISDLVRVGYGMFHRGWLHDNPSEAQWGWYISLTSEGRAERERRNLSS